MLILQNVAYAHPNKDLLFDHINLSINKQDKIALIGNNGAGKSTLLQLMAGHLKPMEGSVSTEYRPYFIPQLFGQFNHLTVAQALRVDGKLEALKQILTGHVTETNMNVLDDDWALKKGAFRRSTTGNSMAWI